ISKNKQSRYARLRVLLAIPAAFALMVLFSFTSLEKNKALLDSKLALPSIESTQSSIADLLGIQQKPVTKKKTTQVVKFAPPLIISDATKVLDKVFIVGYGNVSKDSVYLEVDHNPEFPGGLEELMNFLSKNIRYPKEAYDNKKEGTVFIEFIVNKNGSLEKAKVIRGVGFGCDEEALRVLRTMPDWEPGTFKGKPVSAQMKIPIKFQLTSDQVANTSLSSNKKEKLYKLDQEPAFPGGDDVLMKFIQKNIQYPADAQNKGLTGTIHAQFQVGKDGKIHNPKILRGIGKSCDEEAIRIIKMMPNWIPGKKDGKTVNAFVVLPVQFILARD
ncbi:MAG: energy transducer TonB, partial [Bacteroidetes bacterium]|nr:energy transducer TonB [Bacteroidota bacterium]